VRDYVHVLDLAEAHALALEEESGSVLTVYNLGSGTGASVQEVVAAAGRVTGRRIAVPVGPRRAGDPPRLVASHARAQRDLGWQPRRDLEAILADAWAWHRAHPDGYATL
jgi:UDP-glucose 4-epimerase